MGQLIDLQQIQKGQRIRVVRKTDLAGDQNGEWNNPNARVVFEPAGTVHEGIVTVVWPEEERFDIQQNNGKGYSFRTYEAISVELLEG